MLEGTQSEAGSLAKLAAEARVSINVLLFDWTLASASERSSSSTIADDRRMREMGLDSLAARARGTLFRVAGNPEAAMRRIASELAGHYMLGVEPSPSDHDGKGHTIRVQVSRRGVQVRARQQFQYTTRAPNTWSREDLMARVLRSPSSATQIPMRLATYTYQDTPPEARKVRLVMAADLDPPTGGAADVAVGFVVFDSEGRPVSSGQERKIYSANTDRPLRYEAAISLSPGVYRLRLAAIDLAGNTGSVERDVQAWQMTGQSLALGDLMLGRVRDAQNGVFRPPVLLDVQDGRVATFTELYTNTPGSLGGTTVTFEIADSSDSPTLHAQPARLKERADGGAVQAAEVLSVPALPPGRYVVRAVVTSSGRVVGKLVRPFVLSPRPAAPAAAGLAAGASPGPSAEAPRSTPAEAPAMALVGLRPVPFKREDVLSPDLLRGAADKIQAGHPLAKAAVAKIRAGELQGTGLLALEAGDQQAGSLLRGLELLSKGQLDQAATQFNIAQRNAADMPLAAFYLGACYAAAGRDPDAIANWRRALAAGLSLPGASALIAEAELRLGRPADAVPLLEDALRENPKDDGIRKSLAVAELQQGRFRQAYAAVMPYLASHPADADGLMVALQALYQVHAGGQSIDSPEQDRTRAAELARGYAAANGPNQALVAKWVEAMQAAR